MNILVARTADFKGFKWLRNRNTIEFFGIWEEIYNTSFNSPEFEGD